MAAALAALDKPAIQLAVGDEAQALWKMGRKWYKTRVLRVNAEDGTYYLRYEDGDEWERVPADRVRLPDGTALVASAVEPMKLVVDPGEGAATSLASASLRPSSATEAATVATAATAAAGATQQVLRHAVVPAAVDPSYLQELFPQIKTIFKPQVVKYSNTNPDIRASDGTHGERIDWKVSSYMEVDTTTGGAMQKDVQPDPALLALCGPLLERCNACFRSWYEQLHGAGSITSLVRLQSFITRYRARPNENALLRHIDGAHVDGSIILALPTDDPFQGGGVTVWEKKRRKKTPLCAGRGASGNSEGESGEARLGGGGGSGGGSRKGVLPGSTKDSGFAGADKATERVEEAEGEGEAEKEEKEEEEEEEEITYEYPMPPGDMCLLDNYVWHQGNPITAGERWSLVIFYGVREASQHRILRIVQKAAEAKRRSGKAS